MDRGGVDDGGEAGGAGEAVKGRAEESWRWRGSWCD